MNSDTKHHHSLTLELGYPSSPTPNPNPKTVVKPPSLTDGDREPTLTLGLTTTVVVEDRSGSTSSSLSVKRERESGGSEDIEMERGCNSRASDEDEEGSGPTTTRKKLRLTKDQSAFLEESFKLHSTLNPKQKQALADRLNLRPRQVEVWFQNRRARTKLKQTEVDCEYLKKCCETLTDENRRLRKELDELKSMKVGAPPLYMQLPAATLTMCPSCERIGAGNPPPSNTPFTKPHFFPSFTNPSAAC